MNDHDSERMKGLLEGLGYAEAGSRDDADLILFNTCTIRGSADERFLGNLGDAKRVKRERPDAVVAVGGCWAQSQKERGVPSSSRSWTSPSARARYRAWASWWRGSGSTPSAPSASTGRSAAACRRCASGRTRPGCRSRWAATASAPTASCRACGGASAAARPPTWSPRSRRWPPTACARSPCSGRTSTPTAGTCRASARATFAELLRAVAAVEGIWRVRYTSPHPKDMRADVIAAMAECPEVCEHLHLPAQSGSTRVLKAMRRTYGRERYLDLVARLREAIPDLSLTTDLIVGFPGETEDDFAQTLSLVEECRYDGAYTFLYSPRPGTEAARHAARRRRARGQARAHRPAGRGGAAHRRGARGPLRRHDARGAGRGPLAHGPVAAARPPEPEHRGQLHRDRGAGRAGPGRGSTPRPPPPSRAARPASSRRWPFPPDVLGARRADGRRQERAGPRRRPGPGRRDRGGRPLPALPRPGDRRRQPAGGRARRGPLPLRGRPRADRALHGGRVRGARARRRSTPAPPPGARRS